jgi:type II secretory pathway pseudopilin PulG
MTSAELARNWSARRGRARSGFTLFEMVALLVFVGILTAMAGSKITTIRNQQQVLRASSTVQTEFEKAYAIAGRNRAPIRITWTASSGKLTVTKRDGTITYGTIDFTTYGLQASDVTCSFTSVDVFPNGWASDTASVTISTTRNGVTNKRRVRMSKAGLVKVVT